MRQQSCQADRRKMLCSDRQKEYSSDMMKDIEIQASRCLSVTKEIGKDGKCFNLFDTWEVQGGHCTIPNVN